MAWQDRDYNNPELNYGGSPHAHPILKLFLGSVPIGTWFSIPVRVHATLLWFLGLQLLHAGTYGWQGALASGVTLFFIVLLHEFGHCAGAKLVGGHSDQILLWPLGGLAYNSTDRTPWARFVTVACGPLVNVLIAILLFCVMYFVFHVRPPLHPLYSWSNSVYQAYWSHNALAISNIRGGGGGWLTWAFAMNLTILFFNLIPMYPLDGGKLLQIALWKPLGYFRSMNFACITSMVAAVLLAVWGITEGTLFTVAIAIFAFFSCMGERRLLKYTAAENLPDSPYDLSAAWEHPPDHPHRKKLKKRWIVKARKRAQAEQAEHARIDAILAKVKDKGLHSLTWWEKRALRKATERQRREEIRMTNDE
ncbi:MAG: M50 family metallopeptidase [Phycisphaerales bacterium]|nr:M50 family metallopeptidase [Phycisphaerales bacterium]